MDLWIGSVVIDVNDLDEMKAFWERALGYATELHIPNDWAKLSPPPGGHGPRVSLQQVPEKRSEKNRLHLDLYTKQARNEVERLLELGASLIEGPQPDRDFSVLADPEGNLFCVIDKS